MRFWRMKKLISTIEIQNDYTTNYSDDSPNIGSTIRIKKGHNRLTDHGGCMAVCSELSSARFIPDVEL
ncbi:hypothetical protein DPX16_5389 [Anabarilius grahami]|uniref:Uncharacterized protein n=1 Tax=Anabarilius grahami TaxID=495550 RepID=A0A3N0Y5Z2_ANAGA|nr:hypothetical protein DPX16_5389 [Anabarilius grahami]